MKRAVSLVRNWAGEVGGFARASTSPACFLKIMQVRLSKSKVGRLVCPHQIESRVTPRGFGGPVWLRTPTTDISVLGELVGSDAYGPLVRAMGTGDDRPRIIVDLGANTGLAARWIHASYPHARLVCVEPEPGNVAMLRRNLAEVPTAVVVPACVGGRERLVSLATTNGEFGFAMQDDGEGDVAVVTMERVLAEAGVDSIDILKCDIEGAELELFEDCSSWINRVQAAVVECHDGLTAEGLQAILRRNGGNFTVIDRRITADFDCEVVTLVAR